VDVLQILAVPGASLECDDALRGEHRHGQPAEQAVQEERGGDGDRRPGETELVAVHRGHQELRETQPDSRAARSLNSEGQDLRDDVDALADPGEKLRFEPVRAEAFRECSFGRRWGRCFRSYPNCGLGTYVNCRLGAGLN